jgi:hypothetical protein
MAKKFISLLAATTAIGIATLFAQEPGPAKAGEGTGKYKSEVGSRNEEGGPHSEKRVLLR